MLDRFWGRGNNLGATREATVYLFNTYFLLGMDPPKKEKVFHYFCYFWLFLINFSTSTLLPISFSLSYYYEYNKMTATQLLTSLQVAINVWALPAKYIAVLVSLKRLRKGIDIMNILDARCTSADESEKIRKCVITGNRSTIFYIIFYSMYASVTFVTSLAMGQPPYSLFMPFFDWRNSTLDFIIQSTLEFIFMEILCLHQAADDVYAVIYIYIIRSHLKILVDRVYRLGKDNEIEYTDDEYYKQLELCIRDHQNLLSLLTTISPVISITLFVQITITAAVLGTTLINILIFADTFAQIASIVYFIAVLVQISPCCYQATCLLNDGDLLSLAIIHCEWIGKDTRFRKMLIFFMMRAQVPLALTALKLFPITLNTSLSMAKASFSLYTLIKEMDIGKK